MVSCERSSARGSKTATAAPDLFKSLGPSDVLAQSRNRQTPGTAER